MAYRKLAATASLVLAAEAFMIPSTISLPGVEVSADGDFHALRMPDSFPEQLKGLDLGISRPASDKTVTRVTLECNGCGFKAENSPLMAALDHSLANDLILDFAVSDDRKTLDLNGLPLFPPRLQTGALTAFQSLSKDSSDESEHSLDRPLDYAVKATTTEAADGTEAQLIDLNLSIFGLDEELINVNRIDIRMLQDESENLHLVHIIASSSHGQPQNGHTKEGEATPAPVTPACPETAGLARTMCKLVTKLRQKANDLKLIQPNTLPFKIHEKPCPGRMRLNPDFTQEADTGATLAVPFRGGPHKFNHHPHSHHQHHHHHTLIHKVSRALRSLVFGFLAPVLIGVLAGMTASILGMIVGTLIAWLWVKLVRGGKRGSASVGLEAREALAEEEVCVGEKDGLMLEHAPAYEEAVGEALPVYVEKE